jgi:hypothetical protein
MAKQTLKSLLGSSDERVQVSYDPSEITLAPTVQQTRGSGTVVQAMPQTNQALNFARALNQVPAILGAAKNIGQKQAVEDFSQMNEAEKKAAMEDDKKISRWLGYDKTFQEELVKDHFVRTKGDITQRFTNLAANPADYESDAKFDEAITEEKQALIGELQEKFGNNPNRVMALNAFGDKIMTEVIGQTTEMYETNKINYTLDIKGAHLADQIKDGADPKVAIKSYLEEIKSLDGVDNKLAKANFVVHTTAIGTELKNNGQYAEAKKVIQAALDYEFYKGAKISGKDRQDLSNILDGIERGQEADTERKTSSIATEVRRASESVSYSLLGKEVKDASLNQMKDVFSLIRPNVDLEGDSVTKFFDTLKGTEDTQARIRLYNDFLLELGQGTIDGKAASDLSKEVFNLSAQNLLETQIQLNSVTPESISGLSDSQVNNLTGLAYDYFTANSNALPEQMLFTYGFGKAKVPAELQKIYDEVHKIDYITEVPAVQSLSESDVTNRLKLSFGATTKLNRTQQGFKDLNLTGESSARSSSIYGLLVADIREFARNGIVKQDGKDISIIDADPVVRNKAIGDFINSQMDEYVEIENELFKGRNLLIGLYDETPLTGSVADLVTDEGFGIVPFTGAEDTVKGSIEAKIEETVDDTEYEHIKYSNVKKLGQGKYEPTPQTLTDAYESHRKNKETAELTATMLIYGYRHGFDPKSADDLKRARLGINEVRLFRDRDEFVNTINTQWSPVLSKATNDPDSLTDEEKETLKVLTSFGISNESTLQYFATVQADFLQ